MSCTTVYGAFENGSMVELGECRNAHRGAMWIWRILGERYAGGYRFGMDNPIWELADDKRLTDDEHYALVSTFDGVLVPPGLMLAVADGLEGFKPGTENLSKQAELIREAHTEGARAISWCQTSVCSNPWWLYDTSNDELSDLDDDGRPFNLDWDERLPEMDDKQAWWMARRHLGVKGWLHKVGEPPPVAFLSQPVAPR